MSNLNKEVRVDKSHIADLIRAAERRHGGGLDIEEFDFLTETVAHFVEASIDKFVKGGIEHSDSSFLHEVNHDREISNEIYDLWMYHSANLRRHATKSGSKGNS